MINAIRKLVKLWDDVWAMDRIWLIVKWPFGLLIAWFVIFLIWSMEVNQNFDVELMSGAGKSIHHFGGECRNIISNLEWHPSEPIKNVK